jgi:hypothetical protein
LSGVLNSSVPTNIFKLYSSVPKPTNIFIFVGFDWEPMNLWGAGLTVQACLYSSVKRDLETVHYIFLPSPCALSFLSFATPHASLCSHRRRRRYLLTLLPPSPPCRAARSPPHVVPSWPRSRLEPGPPPVQRYFLFLFF